MFESEYDTDQYELMVCDWAEKRNLLRGTTSLRQVDKLREEVEELREALVSENIEEIEKELGDCLVVLSIIADQEDITLNTSIAAAYNKIKDRKGKMINGLFVKEEDL